MKFGVWLPAVSPLSTGAVQDEVGARNIDSLLVGEAGVDQVVGMIFAMDTRGVETALAGLDALPELAVGI